MGIFKSSRQSQLTEYGIGRPVKLASSISVLPVKLRISWITVWMVSASAVMYPIGFVQGDIYFTNWLNAASRDIFDFGNTAL